MKTGRGNQFNAGLRVSPARVMLLLSPVQYIYYMIWKTNPDMTCNLCERHLVFPTALLCSAPFTCSTLSRGQGSILAVFNLPAWLRDKRHCSAVQTRPVPAASTYCRSSYCKSFYCLFCSHVPLQCRQWAKQNKTKQCFLSSAAMGKGRGEERRGGRVSIKVMN